MRQILVTLIVLGSLAVVPTALAAGPKADGHKHKPVYLHGKEEFDLTKKEHEEQLLALLRGGDVHDLRLKDEKSFMSYLADQAIWTLLVFGGLSFILYRYAWAPIQEGLHKRESSIEQAFKEAKAAREEAEKLRLELSTERAKANEEIRVMIEKAHKDAQQTAAEELARGKAELAAERDRLQRELRLSTDDALSRIWEQSTQLAALISTKAVRKELNESDHRALLNESLAEFRGAAEARKNNLQSAHA